MNKLDNKKKETYLDCLRNGSSKYDAARSVGLSRTTIWTHAKSDPDFAQAIQDAEEEAVEKVENALFNSTARL